MLTIASSWQNMQEFLPRLQYFSDCKTAGKMDRMPWNQSKEKMNPRKNSKYFFTKLRFHAPILYPKKKIR